MNTSQLQCCIECDSLLKQYILGVFAADLIPFEVNHYPYGFIANTEASSQEGKHWIAFYIPRKGHAEIFDSYGKDPSRYNIYYEKWMKKNVLPTLVNKKQIQSNHSNVCGLYCLFFLLQRLRGHSMQEVLRLFNGSDLNANDQFIYNYSSTAFSNCTQSRCAYNQVCKPLIKNI